MNIHPYTSSESDDFYHIWNACFGDSQGIIDEFLNAFRGNIRKFTLTGQGNQVCAALTQFHMGTLSELSTASHAADISAVPVQISYAIGTDPLQRGHGYGSAITQYAAEQAEKDGDLSVLSPADQGLVNFYRPLNYLPFFYKEELTAEAAAADEGTVRNLDIRPLSAAEYNDLRENFLSNRPHIFLSDQALAYESLCAGAEMPEGSSELLTGLSAGKPTENAADSFPSSGFFHCTAPLSCIFTVEPAEDSDLLYIPELLAEREQNKERLTSVLSLFSAFFHKSHAFCMTPAGKGSDTALVHGMVHIPDTPEAGAEAESEHQQEHAAAQKLTEALQIIQKPSSRQPLPAWLGFAFD
ncbi:GNAT family N-acetyltransferase [Eubacterium sp. F2]|uniref:GNAT family N-acetyltransferase n=1 Tax=Eubacterium sp. F2 TaxID=3381348 RepID=UPI0039081B69